MNSKVLLKNFIIFNIILLLCISLLQVIMQNGKQVKLGYARVNIKYKIK